jgi:rhodanese-related sulfurtransferase
MGLSDVAHIEGGFSAWKEAGGSVVPRQLRVKKN